MSPSCPTPFKDSFWLEAEAVAEAARLGPAEAYFCECRMWHVRNRVKHRKASAAHMARTTARIAAAATHTGDDSATWPPEAIDDFIAGIGLRTIARKYGRTFGATKNKNIRLKRQGVIPTRESL